MFKWIFYTIAAFVTLANAYTITYNYTGAEGGSCASSGVKDSVTVRCSAPSGYTWASASLKGEGSSIRYCVPDSCVADIKGDVTFNAEFAKSENVRRISWFETGYGNQYISHGYAAVTDMEKTKFLLAAAVGDSVKMTPIPAERYHWIKWYDRSGSERTEIKTEDSVYVFKMPDMNLLLEVEFDYNCYGVVADMNGGPGVYFDRYCSSFDNCYLWKDSTHWDGHIFQGWMLEKDAQDTFFIPFAMFTEPLSIVHNASVTMYAKWFEAKVPKKVNGCYQIGNANELYGFAYLVSGKDGYETEQNACGELTADIVVNKSVLTATDSLRKDTDHLLYWVPIGTSSKPFMGKFNGKGHTISGLYFKNTSESITGLFGVIKSENNQKAVSIDSVGVIDSYFESSKVVGGIVGLIDSNSNVSINNAYAEMTMVGEQLGGIVGRILDASNISISHSHRSGKFFTHVPQYSWAYMGGLIGIARPHSVIRISNSYNDGMVAKGSYNGMWGGLIGFAAPEAGENLYGPEGLLSGIDTLIIDSCYNLGSLEGEKSDYYYGVDRSIGGLVGTLQCYYASISNSYNSGSINTQEGELNSNYTGGLIGSLTGSLDITWSHNSATIHGDKVGGLIASANVGVVNISTSYNDGDLLGRTFGFAGGLIGSTGDSGTVINSYNVGKVKVYRSHYNDTLDDAGLIPMESKFSVKNSYSTTPMILSGCVRESLGPYQVDMVAMENTFYYKPNACSDAIAKNTAEEFANGSIAWELYNYSTDGVDGHVWGQKVGTDPYPLLNGAGVEGYDGGRTAVAFKSSVNSFSVATQGRMVQIAGAAVGARFHVFDIQGRNIPVAGFANSRINTPDFEITLPNKGRYLISIGGITRTVTIK